MKLYKKISVIVLFCLLLLLPIKVTAAEIQDNRVIPNNKIWTIKFNNEIVFDEITKKSIEVVDKNRVKVNTSFDLGSDNKSILVYPPQDGYKVGEYTLLIKNSVHSKKNKNLKKEIRMKFSVKSDIAEIKPFKDIVAYQGTNYILPETVTAACNDGTIKNVPIKWDKEYIDGNKAEKFIYYGRVEGYSGKVQLNVTIKPMQNIYDLEDYLNKCFGSINTPAGKIIFEYRILKNDLDFNPYDIWVQTRISPYSQIQVTGLQHSIKINNEDKQKTLQILKYLQETMAKDILRYFPNKKIQGGYFEDGCKYEAIHEGYWSSSFFTWTNYNHNEMENYRNTHITEFNWFDRYDKCKF